MPLMSQVDNRRVLIVVPCGSAKVWDKHPDAGPTPARDAYVGSPFKVNREYALRFANTWVVLSAKYGFLLPDDVVLGPYNVTFKRPSTHPIEVEAMRRQVPARGLDRYDVVVGLGGKTYRSIVEDIFASTGVTLHFPFAGMKLGVALGATKRATAAGHFVER